MRTAQSTGRIMAEASRAVLALQNQTEAEKLVNGFRAAPNISAATLYDNSGQVFAEYRKTDASRPLSATPGSKQRLLIIQPVVDETRPYGTLHLETDLSEMYAHLWRYTGTVVLIFAVALFGCWLVVARLQHSITRPLLSLAATAKAVSSGQDYTVRVNATPLPELNDITVAFNQLLDTIEQQHAQLRNEVEARVRAESAEARGKRLLATTLGSIGEGIIFINPSGRIVSLNTEAERLTGWQSRPAAGRPLSEVFRTISEETRAVVDYPVDEVLRLGTSAGLANHTLLIHQNGTEVPIDDSAATIRDENGEVEAVVLVLRDFTAHKQNEVALRESEARERNRATELEAIMESVPAIIWISRDPECRVITGNRASSAVLRLPVAANLSLSSPHPNRPTHFGVYVNGRKVNPEQLPVQRAARGETVSNLEEELRFNDGTSRWLFGNSIPLRNGEGTVYGAVAAFVDISELKQAEQELRRARDQLVQINSSLDQAVRERTLRLEEMVNELQQVSYAIAHDMRAPLRAMGAFAELLEEELTTLKGSSSAHDYCRRMRVAAGRLDKLIHDALNYSKAVLQEPAMTAVDLSPLVSGLIETYPNLQRDRADITIDDTLPVVLGNESLLTQCFSNLLGNAVKFVSPGTRPNVHIRVTYAEEGTARITVEDNGVGIPLHAQTRLFGMFQKLDHDFEGTGIGLAIVRKVVERMGGKVGANSEPGKGSRFWVELKTAENQ